MNSQKRLLDIIIPIYDRQLTLDKLLKDLSDSILKNGYQNLVAIIVVDDASERHITVPKYNINSKLIRKTTNDGPPISRAVGYKDSKAPFVHFHDSDDTISVQWLEQIITQLQQDLSADIVLTGRLDVDKANETSCLQKYFHKQVDNPNRIKSRLIYRNCMGPLGGVTFSRRVLDEIDFKPFASCQDWQMYIDAMAHAKVLVSRPDIQFIFNKTGDDRISHNPRKKILGHLQLAKMTASQSPFNKAIRLFYLYTCKQHIDNKGGTILRFYKKNRIKILFTYLLVSVYWRLT